MLHEIVIKENFHMEIKKKNNNNNWHTNKMKQEIYK